MLTAIVTLFFVVIIMILLHLYARWYLLRARGRQIRRNRLPRTNLVFHVEAPTSISAHGLDSSVLNSLPVFVYASKYSFNDEENPPMECAVCLFEFKENETCRLLPKCNHNFHIECIDMWFHSHSTCPLCRSPVEPATKTENKCEEIVALGMGSGVQERYEAGPGPNSSVLCLDCEGVGSSSFGSRRKPLEFLGISVEVPRSNENLVRIDVDSSNDSPASQSYRSPVSRMLSFKRILSRERRGNVVESPSGHIPVGCGSVVDMDIELGRGRNQ